MLEQLLKQGILRQSITGDFELAHPEICQPASTGCFDSLRKHRDTWTAFGWALEPGTKESCVYVLPLQNGTVARSLVFRKVRRPDVNGHFDLDFRRVLGFSMSFQPHGEKGPVTLIAVLPSGALVVLPGPNQESSEQDSQTVVLTEATDLEPDWRALCAKRLYAFPPDSPFRGIYSFNPAFNSLQTGGVTEQFLEEADDYHRKYTNHAYWKSLLTRALSQAGIDTTENPPRAILDIGCGSGNTVIPLLEMLPHGKMIASDISPQLLALLRDQIQDTDWSRLRLIAMDAEGQNFREGAFELIVGAAILHHLLDPSHTISACRHSLKPGGHAIFFEAFEQGFALLRLLYEQLLEHRSELKLTEKIMHVLKLIITDTDVRTGSDKSDEFYEQIDDKWLFTRTYFERLKEKFGFSKLQIYPLHPSSSPFTNQFKTHLRLCLGMGEEEAVSPQAWDYIRNFERKMSDDFYSELLMEGCIILTN